MQSLKKAEIIESKELSFDDLVEAAYSLKEYYLKDNKVHTVMLKLALRKLLGIRIGLNKVYEVKATLEQDYPEVFDIAS